MKTARAVLIGLVLLVFSASETEPYPATAIRPRETETGPRAFADRGTGPFAYSTGRLLHNAYFIYEPRGLSGRARAANPLSTANGEGRLIDVRHIFARR